MEDSSIYAQASATERIQQQLAGKFCGLSITVADKFGGKEVTILMDGGSNGSYVRVGTNG